MGVDCPGLKIKTPALARARGCSFSSCFDENVWWPVLNSGLVTIGVDWTPRFIAASVLRLELAFRTCSTYPNYYQPRTALVHLINASACAFTTTERALHDVCTDLPSFQAVSAVLNALTCYGLRFVELTAGDQSAPVGYLFSALMLVPVSKLTREKTYSRAQKSHRSNLRVTNGSLCVYHCSIDHRCQHNLCDMSDFIDTFATVKCINHRLVKHE